MCLQIRIHLDPHLLQRQPLSQGHLGQRLVLIVILFPVPHFHVTVQRFSPGLNLDDDGFFRRFLFDDRY